VITKTASQLSLFGSVESDWALRCEEGLKASQAYTVSLHCHYFKPLANP